MKNLTSKQEALFEEKLLNPIAVSPITANENLKSKTAHISSLVIADTVHGQVNLNTTKTLGPLMAVNLIGVEGDTETFAHTDWTLYANYWWVFG